MTIKLFINGKREEIEAPVTIPELLESKRIRPEVSTVAVNRIFLKREEIAGAVAKDGDTVEIMIQLAGGTDAR